MTSVRGDESSAEDEFFIATRPEMLATITQWYETAGTSINPTCCASGEAPARHPKKQGGAYEKKGGALEKQEWGRGCGARAVSAVPHRCGAARCGAGVQHSAGRTAQRSCAPHGPALRRRRGTHSCAPQLCSARWGTGRMRNA